MYAARQRGALVPACAVLPSSFSALRGVVHVRQVKGPSTPRSKLLMSLELCLELCLETDLSGGGYKVPKTTGMLNMMM